MKGLLRNLGGGVGVFALLRSCSSTDGTTTVDAGAETNDATCGPCPTTTAHSCLDVDGRCAP